MEDGKRRSGPFISKVNQEIREGGDCARRVGVLGSKKNELKKKKEERGKRKEKKTRKKNRTMEKEKERSDEVKTKKGKKKLFIGFLFPRIQKRAKILIGSKRKRKKSEVLLPLALHLFTSTSPPSTSPPSTPHPRAWLSSSSQGSQAPRFS